MRAVEQYAVHVEPMDFRELCRRVLRPETRYLVLDLDGTFHKGLNLGVLLGWELSAYQAYGLDFLLEAEAGRNLSALILKHMDHQAQRRYAWHGLTRWAGPAVLYYGLARMGWKQPAIRKKLRQTLGPQAMDSLLGLMRVNLMHHMALVPQADAAELVKSLWRRYNGFLVIEPKDLAWVRRQHPGITLIVSSASPRVCLDPVRDDFPVHDVIQTEIEIVNGVSSSPPCLHPIFGKTRPRRIAPPHTFNENASFNKIANLVDRYPDFLDPDVHTVGITDTKHGEDHCWSEYFSTVAAVNSPDPFYPLVSSRSKVRNVHFARLLTRHQKSDPVPESSPPRFYSGGELETGLRGQLEIAERSAAVCLEHIQANESRLERIDSDTALLEAALEKGVARYNQAPSSHSPWLLDAILPILRQKAGLRKARNRILGATARDWFRIESASELAVEKILAEAS